MSGSFSENAIFWVEVEKVKPNPYQPRRDFDEAKLRDLAESIRQYGILQPLTVSRVEKETPDGGIRSEYELIAGERRLRAARIAGLSLVPVIIRDTQQSDEEKLELAIIENLQREDLNPIDRALAFERLVREFQFKQTEVARKLGKSREYIANSLRLLKLPEDMRSALASGRITEGHARPLMMLSDRPDEQLTLYKEIVYKKLTVRETEDIARKVAKDKTRKNRDLPPDPEVEEMEGKLAQCLGTRVSIERGAVGGKIVIDYFSNDDIRSILTRLANEGSPGAQSMLERFEAHIQRDDTEPDVTTTPPESDEQQPSEEQPTAEERKKDDPEDDDLYAIRNFTI